LIYADSSLLFKRYCQESGSREVRILLASNRQIATASLSYAEVFSALNRKLREHGIDRAGYLTAAVAFEADWSDLTVIPLSDGVVQRARVILERHILRAGDAVQLASALTIQASLSLQFASADHRLNEAARREGLTLA
jgi:predicted nucleic acid-binding protein